MQRCRRTALAAGLSLAALALCRSAGATGEPPAPPTPQTPAAQATPSPSVQRDMETVNRLLRERQQKLNPAPAAAAPAPGGGTAPAAPTASAPPAAPPAAARPVKPAPGAAAIDAAIGRLANESPKVRGAAEKELRSAGVAALPALIDALGDDDERVRVSAVTLLGKTRDPRAVEPLIELLQERSDKMWDALWDALWSLRESAAPALIGALGSNDPNVRWRIVALMGSSRDSRFTEPLIETLNKDPATGVRVKIASTLGKIGDRQACEALLDALHDW